MDAWYGQTTWGSHHSMDREKGVFWKKYIQWTRGLSGGYRSIIYSIACSMFFQVHVWQMKNLSDARREPLLSWKANPSRQWLMNSTTLMVGIFAASQIIEILCSWRPCQFQISEHWLITAVTLRFSVFRLGKPSPACSVILNCVTLIRTIIRSPDNNHCTVVVALPVLFPTRTHCIVRTLPSVMRQRTLKTVNVLLKLEPVSCETLETKVNRIRDLYPGRGCLFC